VGSGMGATWLGVDQREANRWVVLINASLITPVAGIGIHNGLSLSGIGIHRGLVFWYWYAYRGTSLIRNCPPLGPYSSLMLRALWWS